jgi:integrase
MSDDRKRKKRGYGLGRIFPRGPHGILWIGYSPGRGRKERRESSGSTSWSVASKLLKRRQGEVAAGKVVVSPAKQEKYTVAEMLDFLLLSHEVNGYSKAVQWPVKHLRRCFGFERAVAITDDRILLYVQARRNQGAADGTIKLELAAFSRAFTLAIEAKKLSADARPTFPKIALDNARQGFCPHPDFLALQGKLPRHLKDPVGFLYYSGWRVREMRKIQWKHLDPSGKSLRLPPELSKNKKGRLLPLTGELAAIIKRAKARRRLDCPYIFHHNGKPIGSFRKAWKTACVATGLGRFIKDGKGKKKYEGLIVHDLRRSCVRHLIQAGVGEKLAMQLTGHKTRSVFDRYNIVSDADLQEASERQQAYLAKQKQEPTTVTPMTAGS